MMCDHNCFNCPYPDCMVESASEDDIAASKVVDKEILTERYKGVYGAYAALQRYQLSDKGRARQERYEKSDKGRERQRRYLQSEKGREMLKRRTQAKIKSGKNAEYCRRYRQRRKENLNEV